jgi:hypothetical protein
VYSDESHPKLWRNVASIFTVDEQAEQDDSLKADDMQTEDKAMCFSKRQLTFKGLQCVVFQKVVLFITIAVGAWSPARR